MKTAECGRIKNLYEQRGPWHRSVSGCRKKTRALLLPKSKTKRTPLLTLTLTLSTMNYLLVSHPGHGSLNPMTSPALSLHW